jgi:hypothetical protein
VVRAAQPVEANCVTCDYWAKLVFRVAVVKVHGNSEAAAARANASVTPAVIS